jgi:hypothetical protein
MLDIYWGYLKLKAGWRICGFVPVEAWLEFTTKGRHTKFRIVRSDVCERVAACCCERTAEARGDVRSLVFIEYVP